jgi:beta-galactosidase GanA
MAGDFCGGAVEISAVCKLISVLSKNQPVEFMVPLCESLVHHTTDKSADILMMEAYAAIANNSCFVIIDAIDPVGTLNRKTYVRASEIFKEVRRYAAYLSADSSIVADVAIYWSFESLINPAYNGKDISEFVYDPTPIDRIKNIVETFVKFKIPFTLITEKQIDQLSDFQVLILPAVVMLSAQEAEAIRKFVKAGGKVYASGETSLYNRAGVRQENFQLADVFGVSYLHAKQKKHSPISAQPVKENYFPVNARENIR